MRKNIVIIGAGGHGRVVRDVAKLCGYDHVVFLDDSDCCTLETAGKIEDFIKYINDSDFFVAIGNNDIRQKITEMLVKNEAFLATLVHPSAIIGSNVRIGSGTVIAPGAVINTCATIGRGVIVNTCSSIDHDDIIEDFSHVSVGSHLAGTVKIGKRTFVGTGASIINNTTVCDDCILGAGAVVVKDITESGVYVGVPAKKIK